MSNKLTDEKLKELIMEILQEKKSPLDGQGIKINTKARSEYFKFGTPHGQDPKIADLKKMAKLEPKTTHISGDDFEEAFLLPDDDPNNVTAKEIAKRTANAEIRQAVLNIYNDVTKAKQDQLDMDIGKEVPDKISKKDREIAIPDVNLDYFSRKSKSDTDYKKFQPKGYLNSSTADILEGFFERNGANTIKTRLESIAEFSNNIYKLSQKNDEEAKTALQDLGAQGIMNDAILAKVLAKLSREIQGASAGTFFETYLAVLLSGVVTGGAGAAADAGIVGKPIYLSMKFEADSFAGSQSSANLQKELQKAGTIWYIGGKKVGGKKVKTTSGKTPQGKRWTKQTMKADPTKAPKEGGTETVEIFITGVQLSENKVTTQEGQPQVFKFVKLDGTTFVEKTDPVPVGTGDKLKIQYPNDAEFTINLADPKDLEQGAESFDRMFTNAVSRLDDTIKTTVQKMSQVYQSSDKITEKMKSYVAKSDIDAGVEVKNTYMALLATLNNVFTSITGKSTVDSKKTKVDQIKGTLSENKNKSLKDLDKLIERVILESMNKK